MEDGGADKKHWRLVCGEYPLYSRMEKGYVMTTLLLILIKLDEVLMRCRMTRASFVSFVLHNTKKPGNTQDYFLMRKSKLLYMYICIDIINNSMVLSYQYKYK